MRALLPSPSASTKLFATGFTVGPIVDSLHNQCLLEYDRLPIAVPWPTQLAATHIASVNVNEYSYLFCSSWTVPPLLGVAYVVLGGILPRLFQAAINVVVAPSKKDGVAHNGVFDNGVFDNGVVGNKPTCSQLRTRAIAAVLTTAMIIKLSELLQTTQSDDPLHANALVIMFVAALSQWVLLDSTLVALLAASVTSVCGPLSELPFVANGFWHYLPQAADYHPHLPNALQWLLATAGSSGTPNDGNNLALSSITGPCYFAVTMDAIALGRWFDHDGDLSSSSTQNTDQDGDYDA